MNFTENLFQLALQIALAGAAGFQDVVDGGVVVGHGADEIVNQQGIGVQNRGQHVDLQIVVFTLLQQTLLQTHSIGNVGHVHQHADDVAATVHA